MNISSSNTNTANVEGKTKRSRRLGQVKVDIIESDMDDDMQFAAMEIASKDYPICNSISHEMAKKLKITNLNIIKHGIILLVNLLDVK